MNKTSDKFLTARLGKTVDIVLDSDAHMYGILLGFDNFTLLIGNEQHKLALVFKHVIAYIK